MEPPSNTTPNQPSTYKRFLQAIGLDRTPVTAEDFEQEIHDLILQVVTATKRRVITVKIEKKET